MSALGLEQVRPVVFVHVSGSGGSTLCAQARRQPAPLRLTAPGHNCLLPCKSPFDYRLYGLRPYTNARWCHPYLRRNCSGVAEYMHEHGYGVLGATETMLDECGGAADGRGAVVLDVCSGKGLQPRQPTARFARGCLLGQARASRPTCSAGCYRARPS